MAYAIQLLPIKTWFSPLSSSHHYQNQAKVFKYFWIANYWPDSKVQKYHKDLTLSLQKR